MNRQPIQYKGYQVAPVAQQLPNGLFAANLTIGKTAPDASRTHSFDALDYFFDEEHAVGDACGSTATSNGTSRPCARPQFSGARSTSEQARPAHEPATRFKRL
jgi:hypothetical protein